VLATKGWSSILVTLGRSNGSRRKQSFKKSCARPESWAGMGGISSVQAMWYIAVTGFSNSDHGGLPKGRDWCWVATRRFSLHQRRGKEASTHRPVAISITVHPTLQISAFFQPRCKCCSRITSGCEGAVS